MAVYGSRVILRHNDRSIVLLDVIAGKSLAMKLHQSPVRALHYDQSGRLFLSGAMENRIKIVNAKFDADVEESGLYPRDITATQ
jgi:hypothetical protein